MRRSQNRPLDKTPSLPALTLLGSMALLSLGALAAGHEPSDQRKEKDVLLQSARP